MIHIYSSRDLSERELKQIKQILKESKCPNESLINTIEGCQGLTSCSKGATVECSGFILIGTDPKGLFNFYKIGE